jgi:endonuclease/exonuclease/phosphatase family metal-dependent hydrolase
VVNTHLTHLAGSGKLRIAQLDTILGHPEIKAGHDAVFLCGDFNAEPESAEVRYFLNRPDFWVTDPLENASLTGPKITFPTPGPSGTDPSPRAGKRIDYIFSLTPSTGEPTRIVDARVVLNQPSSEGIFPSDHYGVMIDALLSPA